MNVLKAIKLFSLYEKAQAVTKEKASMKVKVPQLLVLFGTLSATIGLPELVTNWVHAHPAVYMGIVAAALVLHTVMPSVFAAPGAGEQQSAGIAGKAGAILLVVGMSLALAQPVHAQTGADPGAVTPDVQNLYAAGVSYSVNASPGVAGTALYAHEVNTSGTYAFTVIDALPETLRPFTVTSNIGVGVAQRVTTFGKVGIYMPTSAGISWSGTNTGWQWNGGAVAMIPLKNGYYLAPTVRFLKSSVSGGSGYQPIVGLLFGWGK